MRGFDIVKIERIQNKELWEAFQLYVFEFRVFGLTCSQSLPLTASLLISVC